MLDLLGVIRSKITSSSTSHSSNFLSVAANESDKMDDSNSTDINSNADQRSGAVVVAVAEAACRNSSHSSSASSVAAHREL